MIQPSATWSDERDRAGGAPVGGLVALLRASARDCPEAVLFRDDEGATTARAAADQVAALADKFRQCGLRPGDRIILVVGATTRSLLALIAALQARLEPALVPCGLGPVEIAAHIAAADAVALVGPTHYGTLALGDAFLSAAALSETIRLIATLGPSSVDGAADLTADTSATAGGHDGAADRETPAILTFEGSSGAPVPVAQRQTALLAAALALADQARINPSRTLLSTIVPATLAGLVAGPFVALLAAAGLALHDPFEARGFLAACAAQPDADLVVPAAVGPLLRGAGLGRSEGSLILLSRFTSPATFILPQDLRCERLVVDVLAFGEIASLARRRRDGVAEVPAELTDGSLPGRLGVALNRARLERRTTASDGG